MFLVSLYCMHNWWKNTLKVRFLSGNSTSASLFSLIFGFMVEFFHLHKKNLGFMIFPKTKALIFIGCSPFILFSEFSHYKKFKFLCANGASTPCIAFSVYICIIG